MTVFHWILAMLAVWAVVLDAPTVAVLASAGFVVSLF